MQTTTGPSAVVTYQLIVAQVFSSIFTYLCTHDGHVFVLVKHVCQSGYKVFQLLILQSTASKDLEGSLLCCLVLCCSCCAD